ncbi:MAG: prolipoprotein diacylglyceryl transferase, partial [Oscillospiraceae bacterium]|nr:prolipoprotein diacylglyceryl transferase [Oscillospiraceae bacterium]
MSNAVISFPFLGEGFVINPPRFVSLLGRNFYLYGIIIAVGFILAGLYMAKRGRTFGFTSDNVIDLLLSAVPLGIVGARIYYIIFNPDNYFGAGKWLNIFKVWEGGLAIYGGIIFGVLGLFIYSRCKKVPFGAELDIASFGVIIGQIFGRWGNFFNREAYGAVTDSFFRMGLTTSSGTVYVHPTFLYESVWNLIGLIVLHFFSKKRRRYDGQTAALYF